LINIDPALKTIYRNDRFPMSTIAHPKDMEACFADLDLVVSGDRFAEDKGEFELSEGICRDVDLKFGKCNSAQVKFTVADVTDDIAGKEFRLKQTVDDTYEMPFGYFTVDTCPKQDDLRFKDITAYDRMQRVNTDVAAWYNGLSFPMTLAAFRASFLAHVGLVEDTVKLPLPNDNMTVEKTLEAAQLPGQEVIEAVEEINGVFGAINPEGKFSHVILKPTYGLYPGTFYPGQEYPRSENDTSYVTPSLLDEEVSIEMRETIRFEEFTVPEIDKLIIRSEEDDIGAIVGEGTNAYIIEGNFLALGKSAAELQTIARNAFGYIAKRPYRPYESRGLGLPYVKPGDMLRFDQDEPVTGYVLSRTLTGTQGLMDEYISPGSRERTQNTSKNTEIIKLKYRTNKLRVDVDGVSVELSDLAENVDTSFNVMHGEIQLKVDKAGVIAAINLTSEEAKISASKINLTGYVTITSLNTPGSVEIDGGNLKAGTVVADTVRSDWIYTNNLNASQITAGTFTGDRINGGTINGTSFNQVGTTYTTTIANGAITTGLIYQYGSGTSSQLTAGNAVFQSGNYNVSLSHTGLVMSIGGVVRGALSADGYLSCTMLNSGTPITSLNVGSYAAPISHTHTTLWNGSYQVYLSSGGNFASGSSGDLGSPGAKWGTVYANTGTIITSDKSEKNSIEALPYVYKEMIKRLKPVRFKYNNGTSDRYHTGFISQDVEELIEELGLASKDLAAFIKSPMHALRDEYGEYDTNSEVIGYAYGLRNDEFISPAIAVIQDQQETIKGLQEQINNILSTINYL